MPVTDEHPRQRYLLTVLVLAQVLSGAGLAAGVTVGALLAQEMLASTDLAGLPAALNTLGAAGAALAVGLLSHRWGRRVGLSAGYAVAAVGSAGVVLAAVMDHVPLLFISLLVYGAGSTTSLQARYAGADLAAPHRRARAIAIVLVATTFGAVVGPNLVDVTGSLAQAAGVRPLAGPFALAAVAYGLAALALTALLRPDPLLTARDRPPGEVAPPPTDGPAPARSGLAAGMTVMVLTQVVMVAVMTMTPIHMLAHGHDLAATGLVISVHIGAMFLPSPLTGQLVDRVGRVPVAAASGVVLVVAGVVAAASPPASAPALAVALGLLGLGWNLGLVSGTTMVTDALPVQTRARTQGMADLGIALAGAGAGLSSGFVVASSGFGTLALAGAALGLAVVPVVVLTSRAPRDRAKL